MGSGISTAQSPFWLEGEKKLDSAINELNKATWSYLSGPVPKTEDDNKIISHVYEAKRILLELERELF